MILILSLILMPFQQNIVFAEDISGQYILTNLALNKNAYSSANETASFTPDLAVDGDTSSKSSRWSSGSSFPGQWIYIDLGGKATVEKIKLYWEAAYATRYIIQVSDDTQSWNDIYTQNNGTGGVEEIVLSASVDARYVRVYMVERSNVWTSVSLYEVEIYGYGDNIEPTAKDVASSITSIDAPEKGEWKLTLPEIPEGYSISIKGSDREAVIGLDGRIYPPLVDAVVNLTFEVVRLSDNTTALTDTFEITVPGTEDIDPSANEVPKVIPSLREWVGRKGSFTMGHDSKIYVDPNYYDELKDIAEVFAEDMRDINGYLPEVATSRPDTGDFYLTLNCSDEGLGEEGYYFDVDDVVTISANTPKGVFYGTRTALQVLVQDSGKDNIPKGIARDYPKYKSRGFMLDVGRKYFPMSFLQDCVKLMSWYKMNEFQVHLNDNYIWINENNWQTAYAAFRLESEKHPGLTAKDGSYSKAEFAALFDMAEKYAINIIPEIDTPAHSLALTQYMPEISSSLYGRDHLDLNNSQTYELVDDIFEEYLPIFKGQNVHIGTDEYNQAESKKFREYTNRYISMIKNSGKTPRLWGSLTRMKDDPQTTVISDNVVMNLWNDSWGEVNEMFSLGFKGINTADSLLYIVPAAGYYRDYLDCRSLYNSWEPTDFGYTIVYPGHQQLLGGMFCIWNDGIGNGITTFDVYDRALPAVQTLGEKMWSGNRNDRISYYEFQQLAKTLGSAPNSNPERNVGSVSDVVLDYSFDDENNPGRDGSGNSYDAQVGEGMWISEGKVGGAVEFKQSTDHISTPVMSKGFPWSVSMWVKPAANGADEQILMESPDGVLKLRQKNTGKVGFSREGYDYSFNYTVPTGEWTHLVFTGELTRTSLYVNGEFVETIDSTGSVSNTGTFVLPLETIGSKSSSFTGILDELKVYDRKLEDYEIKILAGIADNILVSSITVDGKKIDSFDPEVYSYRYKVMRSLSNMIPKVEVTPVSDDISIEIINPQSLPGETIINASSKDGPVTATYKITFDVVDEIYLSDIEWVSADAGWGTIRKDMSIDGNSIRLRSESGTTVTYQKGIGTHANSEIIYDISGKGYGIFEAYIGVDQEMGPATAASITFEVWMDGRKLYDSGLMTSTTPQKFVSLDITGGKQLTLIVTDAGNGIGSDHGDWADTKFRTAEIAAETGTALLGPDHAGLNEEFEIILGLTNAKDVMAQDISIAYNPHNIEFLDAVSYDSQKISVLQYHQPETGTLRLIVASNGSGNSINNDASVAKLKFRVKKSFEKETIKVTEAVLSDGYGNLTFAAVSGIDIYFRQTYSFDLNGDGRISIGDLGIVAFYYGTDEASVNWDIAKRADLDGDNRVSLTDLVIMAKKIFAVE